MDRGRFVSLAFQVTGAGLGRLRRIAVFRAAFTAQVATFLDLALGFGAVAVRVHFLLHEAGGFLDLTLDARGCAPDRRNPVRSISAPAA